MTTDHHARRQLGAAGPTVFPLALGCMGMSDMYGPSDERESIATIHAALDAGITLIDTGDYYRAGHNELLIGRALRDRRDRDARPASHWHDGVRSAVTRPAERLHTGSA